MTEQEKSENLNQETEQNAEQTEQQESIPVDENELPVSDPQDETAQFETKIAELNDKYLRLYSEFDNYRRRTSKEKLDLIKTAGEDVFKSLLPVVDDFERGIKSLNESDNIEALREGVNLIFNKLKNILTSKGLEPMDSIGKPFDADIHDAITNIPAPSEDMKGKVVDEVEKGYLLNGKVIRHAKVIVGN